MRHASLYSTYSYHSFVFEWASKRNLLPWNYWRITNEMDKPSILLLLCSISVVVKYVRCVDTQLPLLTLISMDGFRYDYLDKFTREEVPNFYYMMENGAKAAHVHNIFPSVTLPSHMTLLSGLYAENHGVVHNRFYDPLYNMSYDLFDFLANKDPRFFDNGQETIWTTNQKNGDDRNSGSVLFPSWGYSCKRNSAAFDTMCILW